MLLSELQMGSAAVVVRVDDRESGDTIARRLRDLGFVAGEPVKIAARGPIGADPLLVQIGYTRFALRRAEAARVHVALGETLAPIASVDENSLETDSASLGDKTYPPRAAAVAVRL